MHGKFGQPHSYAPPGPRRNRSNNAHGYHASVLATHRDAETDGAWVRTSRASSVAVLLRSTGCRAHTDVDQFSEAALWQTQTRTSVLLQKVVKNVPIDGKQQSVGDHEGLLLRATGPVSTRTEKDGFDLRPVTTSANSFNCEHTLQAMFQLPSLVPRGHFIVEHYFDIGSLRALLPHLRQHALQKTFPTM